MDLLIALLKIAKVLMTILFGTIFFSGIGKKNINDYVWYGVAVCVLNSFEL